MKKIIAYLLLAAFLNIGATVRVLAAGVKVQEGTRISVVATSQKSSKNTAVGERINLKIQDDVRVNGVMIFRKNGNAFVNVADVKRSRFVGQPGEILLLDGNVTDVNGNLHPVELRKEIVGEEKTYSKILLVSGIFILPLALFGFVKGGDAKLAQGIPMDVTIKNDFDFVPVSYKL